MPRTARVESDAHYHHVTARTVAGRLLLRGARDTDRYLRTLAWIVRELRWALLTYCLMPNHVHLLVRTPALDLGRGFKWLQQTIADYANERDGLRGRGHFWGDRFHNSLVSDEAYACACLRYIARNPVKGGLTTSPEAWPHSAHRALAAVGPSPPFLATHEALSLIGGPAAYRSFVAKDDTELLRELVAGLGEPVGIALALDAHRIDPGLIARHLGVSERTVRRRAAAGRGQKGTVPSRPT